jgi:hypothetical protein
VGLESITKYCKKSLRPLVHWSRQKRDSLQQAIDPTFFRAKRLWLKKETPRAAILCIYRDLHANLVENLVREATALNMKVVLWALDRPVSKLSDYTLGSGPGHRLTVLNRLWESLSGLDIDQLVVTDDDVSFTRGSLSQLLLAIRQCGFGIAQPALATGWNHEFTKTRWLTLARLTDFVEIGPMFVVSKPWIERVVPFPEEFGMGWGLDLIWPDLLLEGCRLGIVDSVCLRHILLPRKYDQNSELERLKSIMKSRKIRKIANTQHCLGVWRPWQSHPPWLSERELP